MRRVAVGGDLWVVLRAHWFRRLFATRLVGQFTDGLVQAALATFVLFSPEREATAPRIAVAFAILLLPYSLIGPFVGVFLDRWRRRGVLVGANAARAGLVGVVALLVAMEHDGPDLAISVLVVLGVGRFVLAALSAGLPHTVTADHLVTANALAPTAGTIAATIGSLVGVGIRALGGAGDHGSVVVLACAVVGYVAAALVARTMPPDLLGPHGDVVGESVGDVLRGLVDGFRHLAERIAAAEAIVVVSLHRVAFGAFTVLTILLLRNTLNPPTEPERALAQLTVVVGGAAIGALVGAVLTPALSRRYGTVPWASATLVVGGVGAALGFLGTTQGWPLLSGLVGLTVGGVAIGFAGQSVKVCGDTVVQRAVSDDHRGRVFSIYDVSVNVGLVAGICLVAFTAPPSGLAPVLDAAVGLLLVLTALWYLAVGRGPVARVPSARAAS